MKGHRCLIISFFFLGVIGAYSYQQTGEAGEVENDETLGISKFPNLYDDDSAAVPDVRVKRDLPKPTGKLGTSQRIAQAAERVRLDESARRLIQIIRNYMQNENMTQADAVLRMSTEHTTEVYEILQNVARNRQPPRRRQ